jgi:hypothetical protein
MIVLKFSAKEHEFRKIFSTLSNSIPQNVKKKSKKSYGPDWEIEFDPTHDSWIVEIMSEENTLKFLKKYVK